MRQRVALSRDRETELSCAQSLVQCPSNLRDDKSRCRLGAIGIATGRLDHLVFRLYARNFFPFLCVAADLASSFARSMFKAIHSFAAHQKIHDPVATQPET